MILTGYITGFLYAVFCLLIAGVAYKLGLPKNMTRKIVHILIGIEWVILYRFMGAGIHFLIVCVFFLILLIVSYKARFMNMISSDADNAPGTVYYALAMTGVAIVGCFIPEVMLPFGIGVFCTSFGDGLAGVVGQLAQKHNPVIYAKKTLYGTITNFIVSSASSYVLSTVYGMNISLWQCLIIGLLSTELELVSEGGFDNLSMTWGTTALAYGFMYFASIQNYIVPILATFPIIIISKKKSALTRSGLITALALDVLVSISFGNFGFVTLGIFFVGAIIVDKIKKHNKHHGRNDIDFKGDCRDAMQVLANGIPAAIAALGFLISGKVLFIIPFVASIAEAFADTCASGIGVFAKKTFDPFRMKKCEKGLSGGMSLVGTFASIAASFIIAFSALLWQFEGYGIYEALIAALAGVLGAIFDSFMGSILQAKYRCAACGKVTEREEHCGICTTLTSGFAVIDNDIVNLISCAFAAALALLMTIWI